MTREEFTKLLPGLANDYKPLPESLQKINNVCLLMVVGPSGSGKSTIIDNLGLTYIPSAVTREPRPEESDGVDMFFLSFDEAIESLKNREFLQVAIGVAGDLYATKVSSYPDGGWATMPVLAEKVPYFRSFGFKETISVFITPPGYEEWMRRLDNHQTDPHVLNKRLMEAQRSIRFALEDEDIHFILNDQVQAAVAQIKQLLNDQVDKTREDMCREIAENLLTSLESGLNTKL